MRLRLQLNLVKTETFLGTLPERWANQQNFQQSKKLREFGRNHEMKATGEVVRFSADVINVDGTQVSCDVVRVGVYNAVCGNKYLEYVPTKGQYQFLQAACRTQARLVELVVPMQVLVM